MAGDYRVCWMLSGIVYSLSIFCAFPVSSSSSKCASCNSNTLRQSQQKAREMSSLAKRLFNKSMITHDLDEALCNATVDWFPMPHITNSVNNTVYEDIDEALDQFNQAFNVLISWNHRDHKNMIKEAGQQIAVLRSNINCMLCNTPRRQENHPVLPAPILDAFSMKLECCRILKLYMDFMQEVEATFKSINRRKKRSRNPTKRLKRQ